MERINIKNLKKHRSVLSTFYSNVCKEQISSLTSFYSKECEKIFGAKADPKKVSSLVIPARLVRGGSSEYDGGFQTKRHHINFSLLLNTKIVHCYGPGCVAYLERLFPNGIVIYDGESNFPLSSSKRIAIPGKFLNKGIEFIGDVKQVFILDSRFENSIFMSE
jgi:hypothetical protein